MVLCGALMKRILLSMIVSIIACQILHAMEKVIVRNDARQAMERLKELPIAREPERQEIHLFSVRHTFQRDVDSPNYYNLIKLIREFDEEAKRNGDPLIPLVVFIENAPALVGFRFIDDGIIHPSIERGLVRYSEEWPFELSRIVNCETRVVCSAAFKLLNCSKIEGLGELDWLVKSTKRLDSHFKEPFKTFGCDIEEIAFNDVLEECDQQFEEIIKLKNSWHDNEEIVAVFESALKCARWQLARLRELIDKRQCKQRKVVDYTRFLLESNDNEGRELLEIYIRDIAAELFDAYLLDSILHLRNKAVRKIAIVAGEAHTGAIPCPLARIYGDFRDRGAVVFGTPSDEMKKKFEQLKPGAENP